MHASIPSGWNAGLPAAQRVKPCRPDILTELCVSAQIAKNEQPGWWVITGEGRAKLRQLGRQISVVADFGRPYRCLCTRRGYYTMEDWISLVETYSLLLLRHEDILEPRVRALAPNNRNAPPATFME